METRTSYLLVGVFLLAAVAGLIGFIIWSVKSDTATQYATYRTYFTGSVSGLNEASDVRFRGIPIGQVTDIRIDPDNVERIRVTMKIVSSTPIKEDSVASVEMQGITGVSYIQISGGSQVSPTLAAKEGQKFPVITAKLSQLEALFADAPELISRVIKLTDEVGKLFSEGNRQALSETLENLRTLSSTLADSSVRVAALIDDTSAMAAELRVAAKDVRGLTGDAHGLVVDAREVVVDAGASLGRIEKGALGLIGTANTTLRNTDATIAGIGKGVDETLTEFETTARSLSETSAELRGLVAENRKPLRDFSSEGLYDLARMIAEMRGLVSSLTRIADRLETDPSLFLFGGSEKGFEAK